MINNLVLIAFKWQSYPKMSISLLVHYWKPFGKSKFQGHYLRELKKGNNVGMKEW